MDDERRPSYTLAESEFDATIDSRSVLLAEPFRKSPIIARHGMIFDDC